MSKQSRAERANALLEDDLFKEVIGKLRDRQIQAFASSGPDETETREQAHRMLCVIKQLEGELKKVVADHILEVRKRGND